MTAIVLPGNGIIRLHEVLARDTRWLHRADYWCRVWPGGAGVVEYVGEKLGTKGISNKAIVDLGCGVGAVGLACAKLGGLVTFVDCARQALTLVKRNCALNDVRRFKLVLWDWNFPGTALKAGAYDLAVGGDILYDPPQWGSILLTLSRALKRNGLAVLGDPGRIDRRGFQNAVRAAGFSVRASKVEIGWPPRSSKTRRKTIDIFCLHKQS